MSESTNNGANVLDPFGVWKAARDANLEAWSKMMIDVVNSDEYAQTSGTALEQVLSASQPFRDALEKTMTQTLAMMNMPSRAEVVTLAQRLVNVEMSLDDMDAKLSKLQKTLQTEIKDTMREAMAKPESHLSDVETSLDRVNAKLDALLNAISGSKTQAETPAKPATKKA